MNTGNKGKFSERIKRISFFKRRKNNSVSEERKGDVKRVLLIPLMFLEKWRHQDRTLENIPQQGNKTVSITGKKVKSLGKTESVKRLSNGKKIILDASKKEKDKAVKKSVDAKVKQSNKMDTVTAEKNSAQKSASIVSDISKYLIKNINNLELMESDLYVLSKFDGDSESLEKCRSYILKLKALQNKLDKMRKQFDIFKENIDFDDILNIDDNRLVAKIIDFRDSVASNITMQTIKNYKLLAEYKYLYSRIDKVISNARDLEKSIDDRKAKLEQANIDFKEFQSRVLGLEKVSLEAKKVLQKQDEILESIKNKVSEISSTKKVEYIYSGFMKLFFNTLKLMGLYMLTPLRRTIPGIAAMTVSTKNNMDHLVESLHAEERTKMIYSADNYILTLDTSIDDLDSLNTLIGRTLNDLNNVKAEFVTKFSKYAKDLPKYNSVLKSLNKMQKEMINNGVKVRLLSDKMRQKKNVNEQTLAKVRRLNNN